MYNILICDDEKDIVSAIEIYLKTAGYSVYKAYNGMEAVDMVNSNDIQLVLMDVMMPQMDGITAMAKIRESSNVPVIMLTAKSEDTDKILGLEVGADDYVTKPFIRWSSSQGSNHSSEDICSLEEAVRRRISWSSEALNSMTNPSR